eukprot:Rmarinus@m.25697
MPLLLLLFLLLFLIVLLVLMMVLLFEHLILMWQRTTLWMCLKFEIRQLPLMFPFFLISSSIFPSIPLLLFSFLSCTLTSSFMSYAVTHSSMSCTATDSVVLHKPSAFKLFQIPYSNQLAQIIRAPLSL